MIPKFETVYATKERQFSLAPESCDVLVLSTGFDPATKTAPHPPRDLTLTAASLRLLAQGLGAVRTGCWLFIYGLPEELPFWALEVLAHSSQSKLAGIPSPGLTAPLSPSDGERIPQTKSPRVEPMNAAERRPPARRGAANGLGHAGPEAGAPVHGEESPQFMGRSAGEQMVFKYWIALDIDDAPPGKTLKPAHQGVMMFQKVTMDKNAPPPRALNIDAARLPHVYCAACGNTLKDWGGKKHLMNPRGAAISDVWRHLPRQPLRDNVIPAEVLERIALLTDATAENARHVIQTGRGVEVRDAKAGSRSARWGEAPDEPLRSNDPTAREDARPTTPNRSSAFQLATLETNRAYEADCIPFLQRVKALHPRGAFDLAFADPPYNLEKGYSNYDDGLADQHYLDWCHSWLAGMADTLKPGGSLFVLNLPKWALHHAAFLSARLEFRHWIVWDALSDPRGKIMPAHYALLWFTKPGGKPVCNYAPIGARTRNDFVLPPEAPQYCLRAACIRTRKARGQNEKAELTDVWFDVHRIKHKRDRDAHPCQLPEKLMERILRLATRPGDVVFDPFGGAGTTAIAAEKLGRKFVVTEIDPRYVRITNEKLAAMREHADMFGEFAVPRKSVTRKRGDVTKKEIERYLQELAAKLGRVPEEADVVEDRPGLLREIDLNYPNRGAAFKRAKIALANAK
jgi:site-specific DNA-methyltransferase (adenine-specific)